MKYLFLSFLLCFLGISTFSQNSKEVSPTPPMVWISWNLFEGSINENLVKEIADAMVSSGMKDAGYEYIIIDDLWHGGRDKNGDIYPDKEKFPYGEKMHSRKKGSASLQSLDNYVENIGIEPMTS